VNWMRTSRSAVRPWSSITRMRCMPSAPGVQGMAPWITGDLAIRAAPSNQKTLSTSAEVLASSGIVSAPLSRGPAACTVPTRTWSAGAGSVNFTPARIGNGVYFLSCCGNMNNAYYKFTGAAIGTIFNVNQGRISFYLKSLVTVH
jgi:hypothetical protein